MQANEIRARLTPWSSVVGQSVQLLAPDGRAVGQLSVMAPAGPPAGKTQREWITEIAQHVADRINWSPDDGTVRRDITDGRGRRDITRKP